MTRDIDERLAEIRARVDAATSGPWGCDRDGVFVADTERNVPLSSDGPDGQFVAGTREDVPWLLALVDELRAVIGDMSQEPTAAGRALRYEQALREIANNTQRLNTVKTFAADSLRQESAIVDNALAQRLAQVAGELAVMMSDERPAPASLVGLARWEMVRCEGALRRLADQMRAAIAARAAMAAMEDKGDG